MRTKKTYIKGLGAEFLARWWLRLRGWKLVAHRYRTPLGEIDLVVRRRREICFVEVKERKSFAGAQDAISYHQRDRLCRAARVFLSENKVYAAYVARFDAVLVKPYSFPRVINQAWDFPTR